MCCRAGDHRDLHGGDRRQRQMWIRGREMQILTERRLKDEPATLEDLSQEYGISRERVRQIEVRAFEKLQKAMKNAMREQADQRREALADF